MPDASPHPPRPPRHSLQKTFLTGLLTLLPIWLTWVVVKFVFVMLSDLSQPLIVPLLHNAVLGHPRGYWLEQLWVQTALALLATIGFILVSGWMARRVIGQRALRWFEALVGRIPLASTIYGSARKLLDILQTQPDGTQRVVLIDFPHGGMKSVGFVTRILREQDTGRELAAVYVPTTPNPTGGYLEIVPVEHLTPTDWTVDQAMGFIISGGAVAPDSIPYSPRGASPAGPSLAPAMPEPGI